MLLKYIIMFSSLNLNNFDGMVILKYLYMDKYF